MDNCKTLSSISKYYEENMIKSIYSFIKLENISSSYDPTFLSNYITEKASEYILLHIKNEKIKKIENQK